MLCLVVALDCEARPLREHWRLQAMTARGFRVYGNADTRLVVSGPGVVDAATATAYLAGLTPPETIGAWLNLGVAGHAHLCPGSPRLAHSILHGEARAWYPSLPAKPPCPLGAVHTVDRPETRYAGESIYEMEAAGFYASASRFATAELIQVLKIISDNRTQPMDKLNAARVTALIRDALPVVEDLANQLRELQQALASLARDPPGYRECLERWHFTDTQRIQLRRLLERHRLLIGNLPAFPRVTTGRALLGWLQSLLDSLPPQLDGPSS